jgi:hypothetical protein
MTGDELTLPGCVTSRTSFRHKSSLSAPLWSKHFSVLKKLLRALFSF